MCNLGTVADNFNPQILYASKIRHKGPVETNYHCHWHLELSYILSGTVSYNIDGSMYTLKKGDFLLFNPKVYHNELLSNGEEVVEFHIGFDNIFIKGLPKNFLLKEDASSIMHLKRNNLEFAECINQMVAEQEKHEPGYELILKSLSMKLIVMILRENYFAGESNSTGLCSFNSIEKSNIVQTIISFMKDNYAEEISLSKMSKSTYLSPVYISKIFKEETGFSPINYLINIRLEKAKEMLEEGILSIKVVAKTVGYDDAYYFSKLFKKYYGYPPSKTIYNNTP